MMVQLYIAVALDIILGDNFFSCSTSPCIYYMSTCAFVFLYYFRFFNSLSYSRLYISSFIKYV